MSQSFNFSRFGRLFSKHMAEHGGGYLLAAGVLIGGITLVLGFLAVATGPGPVVPEIQGAIFVMGLLAAGAFFASTVFAPLGDKRQATAALMLPASHGEKYLVSWLVAGPLFLAAYVGCFFLVDALVLQVEGRFGPQGELVALFSNESHLYLSLPVYAVVSAVFLWGSVFFVKQQFVRTAFGVLAVAVALGLLNGPLMQALVGHEVKIAVPLSGMSFMEGKEWFNVNLAPEQNTWFVVVMLGGLLLLAWAGAYARLTEKEV